MPEIDLNSKRFKGPNDLITFGKYKGKTLAEVAKVEARYLLWANEKIDWFDIDEDYLIEIENLIEAQKHSNAGRRMRGAFFRDDLDDEIPF